VAGQVLGSNYQAKLLQVIDARLGSLTFDTVFLNLHLVGFDLPAKSSVTIQFVSSARLWHFITAAWWNSELPDFLGGQCSCASEGGCLQSNKGPWEDHDIAKVLFTSHVICIFWRVWYVALSVLYVTLGSPPRLTFLRGYVRPSNVSAACNSLSGVFRGHFFFLFPFLCWSLLCSVFLIYWFLFSICCGCQYSQICLLLLELLRDTQYGSCLSCTNVCLLLEANVVSRSVVMECGLGWLFVNW
jgi:hypothetical protein